MYIYIYIYIYVCKYICIYIYLSPKALVKNSCASPTNTSTVIGPRCNMQDTAPATEAC